jgi:hypothetical protein
MANFQYKNPLSPIQVLGPQSVSRTSTFGTNFSILGTGGYMEVYGLTDLNFVIPVGQTGFIEYSGNTIPIEFNKGTGTAFSPDVLTLNSDNMSSGRRRLGMLVYVYETNKIYRHTISNYGGLWSAATDASGVGGATVVVSDFGTTVKNNSVAGQNFINAWTASTVEGIGGYTNLNATWRELVTGSGGTSSADTFVTGFTLTANTITLTQNRTDQYSSFTISLSAYTGSSVTSGEYLPLSGGTVTGNTIFQSGFTANTLNVTGNTLLSGLTASTISATTYQNVSLNFKYEIHVSQVDGSDTTGNGTLLNPVASITKGLTLVDSQRKTVIVHPGTYTESPSITVQYTTITGPGLIGGNIVIAGTVSTNNGCSISGIKMTNLTITASAGTGNVNILNCEVSGTLTKSSNSDYTLIRFCDIGTTNITGGNLVAIFGGNPNFITVNGGSARVIVKNAVTVAPVLTAGGLTFADSIILSTGATSNAFTTAAGTLTTLANSQIIVPSFSGVARVSLSGFYSILNCVFDKPNSTLVALSETGGSTNSIDYFQYINADKFITQGGTSLQYVMGDGSLSNGFTGGTVSGATNFTNGLTASTISATTYQNLPVTADTFVTGFTLSSNTITLTQNRTDGYSSFTISLSAYTGTSISGLYLPLSGGTVTGNTIFNSGLTANTLTVTGNTLLSGLTAITISATTYQNVNAVTGGTYSNGTITLSGTGNFASSISGFPTTFINNYLPLSGGTVTGNTIFNSGLTANTLNVTGNTLLSGLTATTISATTYYNLPVTADTFVTGFTLSSNTITLTQNRTDGYSSFTISLSAYTGSSSTSGAFLPLSGGTVSGNTIFTSGLTANTLNVTGNTLLSGLTATTISATTYQNVNAVTGGTYSNGTITLSGTGNVNGNTITGLSTGSGGSFTGGTVSGVTNFISGLTATTILAGSGSISSSAVLEVSSTTQGFLPPRMTEAQRIAITSPATGLMVYQTDGDEGLYINKSFGWVQII